MGKNYWLHRISHEAECSYPLLKQGFLTIGWRAYSNSTLLSDFRQNGNSAFDDFMKKENITSRSRFSLKNALNFKKGDSIVVPLFCGKFEIYEVLEDVKAIQDLPVKSFENNKNKPVILTEQGLQSDGKLYDLGFYVKVERKGKTMDRSFANSALISRMKIRSTNARIDKLEEEIDELPTRECKKYFDIKKELAQNILKDIHKKCSADDFEKLVCWYMQKLGAKAYIPAKNESDKFDYADADVVAEFDDLNIVIYIQVKKHEDITGEWAVEQVVRYKEQMQNQDSDFTYINWVISTADDFTEEAKIDAKENNVYLINGEDFAERLLNSGLSNIEKFLDETQIKL